MKKHVRPMSFVLAAIMALSIAGCSPAENKPTGGTDSKQEAGIQLKGHNSGLTERTAAEGYYVQYLGKEDLGEALFGPWDHPENEVSSFQVNSLVLTNNEFASRSECQFAYEPGQRYEFTKDFRDTWNGTHFIFMFYGTYTVDGDQVTLSKPETFSYNLWTGDGNTIAKPDDAGGWCANPDEDPYVNAMNTAIMNYRCAYGSEEMTLTIDQENFTFAVNEVNEDD